MNRLRIASTWLVLLALPWGLRGQETPRGSFSDTMDVNVVNVDVVVTDKKGTPVLDLTEKDFQVLVDKKKTKITNFYLGKGAPSSTDERLSLIVYVDSFNLRPGNRGPVFRALKEYLSRRMSQEDISVMVVSSNRGIQMRQDLTRDYAVIEAALDGLAGEESAAPAAEAMRRNTSNAVEETLRLMGGSSRDRRLGSAALEGLFSQLRGYAEALRTDVTVSLEALTAFANALAGIPGRKAVFYVSDGLAMRPLDRVMLSLQNRLRGGGSGQEATAGAFGSEFGADSATSVDSQGGGGSSASQIQPDRAAGLDVSRLAQVVEPFETTDLFTQLIAVANTNRVTFYTILAPPGDASGAQLQDTARGSDATRLSNLRESLELLASSTAGLTFSSGTNVTGFLDTVTGDSGAYYSLGIAPRERSEGSYHAVEIKLKGRGLRYRYRQGYISKSFHTRLSDRTVGALVLGVSENPHEVEIQVDSQTLGEDGNYDVSVVVTFPIKKLQLLEEGGVHQAQAKVTVALMTSQGNVPPVQHMEVPLRIPGSDLEQARQQLFGARVNLRMPEGTQKLAVGLWDEAAGAGSFISEELEIGGS